VVARSKSRRRGLSQPFLDDLKTGTLAPLRDRVLDDRSLCLEIRQEYINIYYRGGNLLRIRSSRAGGYEAFFDPKYARLRRNPGLKLSLPRAQLQQRSDALPWLDQLPNMKLAMDLWLGEHPKEEREVQQLIVRDNNFGGVVRPAKSPGGLAMPRRGMGRHTDYYICDIEYANANGRFDMVAVHWPSTTADRKRARNRRLVLVEVKHGDGALGGKAGLHSHIADVNAFLGTPGNVDRLKGEMLDVFNQKRSLGLIDCGKDLASFSEDPPYLLIILANHDPDKTELRGLLASPPRSDHAELCFATSCFMGYGLFDNAIHDLATFRSRFAGYIHTSSDRREAED